MVWAARAEKAALAQLKLGAAALPEHGDDRALGVALLDDADLAATAAALHVVR